MRLRLLSISLLLISSAVSARAQRPAHLDELDEPLPADIRSVLENRRLKPKLDGDSDLLKKMLKAVPDGLDPASIDPKLAAKMLKDNPDLFTPENLEKLRGMVQDQMRERPNFTDRKIDWGNLDDTLKKFEEFRKENPNFKMPNMTPPKINPADPKVGPMTNVPPTETTTTLQQPGPEKQQEKQFSEMANWLGRNFGNSQVARDAASDFAKLLGDSSRTAGASAVLSTFQNEWKSLVGAANPDSGIKLSDLADKFKLPDVRPTGPVQGPGDTGGRMTTADTDSGSDDRGGGSNWLLLAVLAALGIGGWIYYRRSKRLNNAFERQRREEERKSWPIDPARVASREDVVRAFDHLSVARCGQQAEHWNHQQVAGHLVDQQPKLTTDIGRLAGLYEKARYAPTQVPFNDQDVAEARSRLCVVAGVTSA